MSVSGCKLLTSIEVFRLYTTYRFADFCRYRPLTGLNFTGIEVPISSFAQYSINEHYVFSKSSSTCARGFSYPDMAVSKFVLALASILSCVAGQYSLDITGTSPFSLAIKSGDRTVVNNAAVLVGTTNTTTSAVTESINGDISNNGGHITATMMTPTIAKIEVNSTYNFVGAQFDTSPYEKLYGVWEYPWDHKLTSNNVTFDLKGVGNGVGINWFVRKRIEFQYSQFMPKSILLKCRLGGALIGAL